jgi:cobalt/nickel transport system ATP-binding protein
MSADKIALRIKDLVYTYPDGRRALNVGNIEIDKGMKVALIGKNGSGKTTLLMHIVGLLNGEGEIEVNGILRTRKNIDLIRREAGILFGQTEFHFIMPDVLNDVMLSMHESTMPIVEKRQRAMDCLAMLGIPHCAAVCPLDLSAGEMKRASLAGVLAGDPSLLLMDEPLNNLDRDGIESLIEILKGLRHPMLVSTHRKYIIEKLATHCAIMDNGRITEFIPRNKFHGNRLIDSIVC